jgi:hypothetical protein
MPVFLLAFEDPGPPDAEALREKGKRDSRTLMKSISRHPGLETKPGGYLYLPDLPEYRPSPA